MNQIVALLEEITDSNVTVNTLSTIRIGRTTDRCFDIQVVSDALNRRQMGIEFRRVRLIDVVSQIARRIR